MPRQNLLLLGGFIVLFVLSWPFLMARGRVPVNGNVLREVYPNWVLTQNALRAGQVPLWNPAKNMGEPHLADPKTLAAYPVRWLLAFIAPSFLAFFRLWVLIHTALALVFSYRLARRLGLAEPSAATGAVLATLNGFFMAHAVYPNLFAVAAYLPAILYYLHLRSWTRMGVMLALQWLAGYPPFSLITGIVLVFVVGLLKGGRWKDLARAGALAGMLAAYHILPFAELLQHSTRSVVLNAESVLIFSIPWKDLLKEIFLPQWIWYSPKLAGDPVVMLYYAGLPAAILAIRVAVTGGARARWLGIGTLVALVLCLGRALPGYAQLSWLHVFRFPASWLYPASFGVAALAAWGVSKLATRDAQWAAAGIIALDLLIFAQSPTVAWFEPSYFSSVPANAQAIVKEKTSGRLFTTNALQEYWVGDQLRTREDYVAFRDQLPPSLAIAYGVREASSYQVMTLKSTAEYLARLSREGPGSPLLGWAGISHVMTFLKAPVPGEPPSIALLTMKAFRPVVFAASGVGARVIHEIERPGYLRARVESQNQGTIVFSEADYPGWVARVDGVQVPIRRWEGLFLSVDVPAGHHSVEFQFGSNTFRIGLALTGLAVIGLLGLAAWAAIKGKRSRSR